MTWDRCSAAWRGLAGGGARLPAAGLDRELFDQVVPRCGCAPRPIPGSRSITANVLLLTVAAPVGGMNIGWKYRYEWHDMMVRLTGPVVGRLEKDYEKGSVHAGPLGDFAYAWISLLNPPRRGAITNGIDVRPRQPPAAAEIRRGDGRWRQAVTFTLRTPISMTTTSCAPHYPGAPWRGWMSASFCRRRTKRHHANHRSSRRQRTDSKTARRSMFIPA